MSSEQKITKIQIRLEDHESRIRALEKFFRGATKRDVTKRKSISDQLIYLKSKGYFDQPHTTNEIVEELAREGYHYQPQSLTWSLQRAVQKGVLGRIRKERKWAYCKR